MNQETAFAETKDIWVLVQQRQGVVEESAFGLIAEARRLFEGSRKITALVLGSEMEEDLNGLGRHGADRILFLQSPHFNRYHGELFSKVVCRVAEREKPSFILMADSAETADLGPRLAASLNTGLVNRVMDLNVDEKGAVTAVRPTENGYLFEEVEFRCGDPFLVSFLPSVLREEEPDRSRKAAIMVETVQEDLDALQLQVVALTEPDPGELSLEEADVIVSGGRGVGKAEAFEVIRNLAEILGAPVSGTRPVVDWGALPYERQIGQTGKTVSPRLLFACGISGANEYTAGMEKSQLVIAVNTDDRARIFRFADLGVIGDLHEVLPLLIERIKALKGIP